MPTSGLCRPRRDWPSFALLSRAAEGDQVGIIRAARSETSSSGRDLRGCGDGDEPPDRREQPPRSTCNVDLAAKSGTRPRVASEHPPERLPPPTACAPSRRVCDYADFVAAGIPTTSAFGVDVGIIGMSA